MPASPLFSRPSLLASNQTRFPRLKVRTKPKSWRRLPAPAFPSPSTSGFPALPKAKTSTTVVRMLLPTPAVFVPWSNWFWASSAVPGSNAPVAESSFEEPFPVLEVYPAGVTISTRYVPGVRPENKYLPLTSVTWDLRNVPVESNRFTVMFCSNLSVPASYWPLLLTSSQTSLPRNGNRVAKPTS